MLWYRTNKWFEKIIQNCQESAGNKPKSNSGTTSKISRSFQNFQRRENTIVSAYFVPKV